MDRPGFNAVFKRIKGCTFASLDTVTIPSPGFRMVTMGTQVILFTNKTGGSGYERMVKRRLEAAGKDPLTFSVGDLPWGERVPNTPLIVHKQKLYLQTVLLRPGDSGFFVGNFKVDPLDYPFLKPDVYEGFSQGLPIDNRVRVRTFKLESIESIHILGETLNTGELMEDANSV